MGEPRTGDAAYHQIDKALDYIQKIHATVLSSAKEGSDNLMALTQKVAASLLLPPPAVSPLLA
jgi:hypothetical protein